MNIQDKNAKIENGQYIIKIGESRRGITNRYNEHKSRNNSIAPFFQHPFSDTFFCNGYRKYIDRKYIDRKYIYINTNKPNIMHQQAKDFLNFIKSILPEFFIGKQVLDVGSGDINGNNLYLFENCEYNGNDVIEAKNVTIVSKTKDLPFEDNTFDTIVSTECFEHDPEYEQSLQKIYKMLKSNGLLCFTCASTGRAEHGTMNSSPCDSYGTIGQLDDMCDYYKNLTNVDINEALDLNSSFAFWDTYYNPFSFDLYFVGIKKGEGNEMYSNLSVYLNHPVIHTNSSTFSQPSSAV